MLSMVTTHSTDTTSTSFDLMAYLRDRKQHVEAALDAAVKVIYPETIYESMRYSLLAGGKRLRPILCLATCELLDGTMAMAMPTACALEMIHTMSLIHDDLPAMDNDDYRRGKLTNHKVYGDDVAILAGDALLTYAFEYIATQTRDVPPELVLKVVATVGKAAGASGLVGGQVLDLACEGNPDVTVETLNFIHTHKTGALLKVSVTSGAILAGADDLQVETLAKYAERIGLAFQIVDDVLDVTATSEELGKSAGKDLLAQKATYPSLWGIEESRQQAQQLVENAKAEVSTCFGEKAQPLLSLADFIVARTH
ncbi:MAG: polyprenyl synthetase family protein [Leptolyngbya sp. SIO1D8]|nr:polyprenyl synthetase family protein [Leptolyngbya sp. SIO1D8]